MGDALRDYIKRLFEQGYTEAQVRQSLLEAGYPVKLVEHALHGPVFSMNRILIVLAGIIVVVLGLLFLPSFFKEDTVTIFTDISHVTPDQVSGSVRLSSTTSKKINLRISVVLVDASGRSVANKQHKVSFQENTVLPVTFKVSTFGAGSYTLRAATMYKKTRLQSEKNVIVPKKKEQEKPAVLVLKTPAKVEDCPGGCDDFNSCTIDRCVDGDCQNTPRSPCCGNGQCEEDESPVGCPRDCVSAKRRTYAQVIEDAEKLAAQSPDQASQECAAVLVVPQADLCFSQVARTAENSKYCNGIQTIANRDDCYAAFAQKEPEVCEKIYDQYIRNACFSLSQTI